MIDGMRILMVNTRPEAMRYWGGDTTQILETRKALQRLGTVVDLAEEGASDDGSSYDLIHLFNLQTAENGMAWLDRAKTSGKPIALSTIYWDLRYARHPDNLRYGDSAFWSRLAMVWPGAAMAMHRVRFLRGYHRQRRAQAMLLQNVKLILPNSIAELESLVAQFTFPGLRAKAVIVPNAVNPPATSPAGGSQRFADLPEKFVLMAAGYHPIKGQARLIQALMGKKQIPLVCVGHSRQGRYGRHCEALAAQRGNTFLLDAVSHEDMPQLYCRAKVHALPSLRESPGLASLEASIFGANCVVGIHSPVQEYFGHDCFVCDPLNSSSLGAAVLAAWKTSGNRKLADRILRDFTWARAAEETLLGYEWMLRTS
jgi:glycosyltransferase involved in cell wall biosynthesis